MSTDTAPKVGDVVRGRNGDIGLVIEATPDSLKLRFAGGGEAVYDAKFFTVLIPTPSKLAALHKRVEDAIRFHTDEYKNRLELERKLALAVEGLEKIRDDMAKVNWATGTCREHRAFNGANNILAQIQEGSTDDDS